MLVINPKRINETVEEKPYWYNYYAGYSHSFTKEILASANLPPTALVLDPWNGGGTTTLMASEAGLRSIGIDLNPVMKVIAKAKQATVADISIVDKMLEGLTSARLRQVKPNDPLGSWLDSSGIAAVRRIENLILEGANFDSARQKVDSLSVAQCVLYTALFNCTRSYLGAFISSNPTWIKKPRSGEDKVSISWPAFKYKFKALVLEMLSSLEAAKHEWPEGLSNLLISSSTDLPIADKSVDFILTSPPYCTRIDYGVATSPELAIVSVSGGDEIQAIRRQLMGTTTVPQAIVEEDLLDLGAECIDFLEKVRVHSSKASNTYYYKNLAQYFVSLSASLKEVSRVLKFSASFICVVQDSFYKDVHCNLAGIIEEISSAQGMRLKARHDFTSKQNMANLNAKSKSYRRKTIAVESVLVLEKER